jgi:hypothetical protein
MRHGSWILSAATTIAIVVLLAASGCGGEYVTPGLQSGDVYLTQAAANLSAATAIARTAEAQERITVEAQLAEEKMTADVREQFFFEMTQTAVLVQATEAAATRGTATAVAQIQATGTAQAIASATTAAQLQATETAEAAATATSAASAQATQTAAPVETRTALQLEKESAETDAELTRLKWKRITAPVVYVAEIVFWGLLIVIGLVALIWAIPRLYHLLSLRVASQGGENGDKAVYVIPMIVGLIGAWLNPPDLVTYDPDRDEGPGLRIEAGGDARRLPGGNPQVAMRDQAVDMVHRSTMASGRRPSQHTMQRLSQSPRYRVLPPTPLPHQLVDTETVRILNADWRSGSGEEHNG